jgi:magnesium chelatase subunit D
MSMVLPFTALVGQTALKRALLAACVDPHLGGVLVRGEKGTGKSTAIRALAALLPEREIVAGCPCGCRPHGPWCRWCEEAVSSGQTLAVERRPVRVVELPLGATEDRVAGSIDLERAVRDGVRAFQPGLLATANGNILYVDEVNLLDDHLVDLILDAAASGWHTVEREGISFAHPASFVLVGSMNPEEGEIRPQLLDRFGLCVEVSGLSDAEDRVRLMRLCRRFDAEPGAVAGQFRAMQDALAARLARAGQRVRLVSVPAELERRCAELALEANVAGHRADIVLRAAARALAALEDRANVRETDLDEAANLALVHRRRMPPPQTPEPSQDEHKPPEPPDQSDQPDQAEQQPPEQGGQRQEGRSTQEDGPAQDQTDQEPDQGPDDRPAPAAPEEQVFAMGEPFQVRRLDLARDRVARTGSGRRCRTRTASRMGRYSRSRMDSRADDLALDATLRAAAVHQVRRGHAGPGIQVERDDYRRKVRERRVGTCIVLAVDASGSMGVRERMVAAKGAVLSLLMDAYQKRDKVALVAFRGDAAEILLSPTSSVELAYKALEDLPTGGRTPLSYGLEAAYGVLTAQLRRDPGAIPMLVLISDCRANVARHGGKPLHEAREMAEGIREDSRIRTLVIDTEPEGVTAFGLARELAGHLGAGYHRIEDLKARDIVTALRQELSP